MAIYSELSQLNMVIFHSYVSLPEGIYSCIKICIELDCEPVTSVTPQSPLRFLV